MFFCGAGASGQAGQPGHHPPALSPPAGPGPLLRVGSQHTLKILKDYRKRAKCRLYRISPYTKDVDFHEFLKQESESDDIARDKELVHKCGYFGKYNPPPPSQGEG
jgi:hypothetical protein